MFGLCTRDTCLFIITIVSYRCFILSLPYTLVVGWGEIPKITEQDTRIIVAALPACDGRQQKHALRCLIGCNIGEGIGAAMGFMLGWDMISTLVLAVGLAFAVGYAFTIIPMLKTMPFRQAARVTVVGDTASIAAMEITENSLVFVITGFMHAALTDALFWLGLGIILPAGYAVAYPAMYWAMKREQKREGIQTHHHH